MVEKLEFLTLSASPFDEISFWRVFLGALALLLVLGSISQSSLNRRYAEAKSKFLLDPSNQENRQNLILLAKKKNARGASAFEVISLLDDNVGAESKSQSPKADIATELKVLADLREKGALTGQEFEQAKAKLLK